MLLKITTLFIVMMVYSFDGYACMFRYMPYDLKKDREVVFTARIGACHTVNGKGYTTLSVQKIWKGEVRPIYTSLEDCSRFQKSWGKNYMISADYKGDKGIIEIPLNTFCTQSTMPIDLSMKDSMHDMLNLVEYVIYYGSLKDMYEIVIISGEANWGLGKPLHDYRAFRYDESLLNRYVSMATVLLMLIISICVLLSPLFIYWTQALPRKFRIKE